MSAVLAFNYPVFPSSGKGNYRRNWQSLESVIIFWIKTCHRLGDYWCVARANLDWFVCVLSAIKPLICPWEETGVECNDMSDFPLGWLLGSQGTVSSEAKQPFSRSVLSQRKVTINDFFTLQSVSSPLLPSVTTLGLDDEGSLELTIKRFTMWQSC